MAHKHKISIQDARAMVKAHHEHTNAKSLAPGDQGLTFAAEAFAELLAQKGAHEVRAHFARHNGHPTLVFTAHDATGALLGDVALQNGDPWPPKPTPDPVL